MRSDNANTAGKGFGFYDQFVQFSFTQPTPRPVHLQPNCPQFAQMGKFEGFAINVLTRKQARLSTKFATALSDKWKDVQFDCGLDGAPILADVAASLECRPFARRDGDDHLPFIARVVRFQHGAKTFALGVLRGKNTTNLKTVRADEPGLIFGAWPFTRANDASSPSLNASAVDGPDLKASRLSTLGTRILIDSE